MTWSYLFLAVTLVGAWFTFNAYLPQRRIGPLAIPSFFAGWLTAELAAHHFAWQLAATLFFVFMGALDAWPGWLGLGITLASWAALLALLVPAERSKETVEDALTEALGDDYREELAHTGLRTLARSEPPPGRLLNPFRLSDPEVEVTRDLTFGPHGKYNRLDLYAPRVGADRAPVLLQIHGGAWMIGDKREQALPLMLHLAARGWLCVTANYRLSPKATFPDHLVDVKQAIRWIRENIADHGGDPDFLAITGGSAGGHLSSLAALTANDPRYQPGFESVDTAVRACVPFYGVYDFTNRHRKQAHDGLRGFLERSVMKKSLADDPKAFEDASPLHRVHPGAPPFFVIHGSHDSLASVEEARLFVRRLRAVSRQPVAYAEIFGAQHAFELFHSVRTRHVVAGVDRFLGTVYARARAERGVQGDAAAGG